MTAIKQNITLQSNKPAKEQDSNKPAKEQDSEDRHPADEKSRSNSLTVDSNDRHLANDKSSEQAVQSSDISFDDLQSNKPAKEQDSNKPAKEQDSEDRHPADEKSRSNSLTVDSNDRHLANDKSSEQAVQSSDISFDDLQSNKPAKEQDSNKPAKEQDSEDRHPADEKSRSNSLTVAEHDLLNTMQRSCHPQNDQSPIYLLDPDIRNRMKDHQIEGLNFLIKCVMYDGSGCLLAHAMGLGKTLQIASFCHVYLRNNSKTILMLMPVNTISNCYAEFDRWFPSTLKVTALTQNDKSASKRLEILNEWSNGGVLLCSYETFRSLTKKHTKTLTIRNLLLRADVVVCDEGHRIRNSDTALVTSLQEVYTKLRIVMSGYPLQNNLQEYWCILNFMKPGFVGSSNDFKNLFTIPIKCGQYIDSSLAQKQLMLFRSFILSSMLAPFVHRRCESIITSTLPKKYEYTLVFQMTTLQSNVYQRITETDRNPISMFALSCKICNDPNILYEWLENKSDIQNSDIDEDEDSVTDSSSSTLYESLRECMRNHVPELIQDSPKLIVLFELIEHATGIDDKMLIFTQSLHTLDMIEKCFCSKYQWKLNDRYFRIDGSTTFTARRNIIEKFNTTSKQKVLLFSTKSGCMGINVTKANRVVILDASFNPSDDLQAIARVYRYGQEKEVFIYRFIMDATLETTIYLHQIEKQQMSHRILDSNNHLPILSWAQSSYSAQQNVQGFTPSSGDYHDVGINNLLLKFPNLISQTIENPQYNMADDVTISKFEEGLAKVDIALASCFQNNQQIAAVTEYTIETYRESAACLVKWLLGKESPFPFLYKLCTTLAEVVAENLIMQCHPKCTDKKLTEVTESAYKHIYILYHDKITSYSKEFISNKVTDLITDAYKDVQDMILEKKTELLSLATALQHAVDPITVLRPLPQSTPLTRLSRSWYNV